MSEDNTFNTVNIKGVPDNVTTIGKSEDTRDTKRFKMGGGPALIL